MKIKVNGATTEQFTKRLLFLLWQASGVVGLGFLQDRGAQSEDNVWKNIIGAEDYAFGGEAPNKPKTNRPYGDYVFGRMFKFGLEFDNDSITIVDQEYRPDYQSWSRKYRTIEPALDATAASLNCTYEKCLN